MKNILLFLSLITIIACDTEDRDFFNSVYVTSQTPVIKVESTTAQYNIGDYVFVNTDDFTNIISEPGQSTPLNIFKTTNSTFMRYFFSLEKNVNGEWTKVILNNTDLTIDSGIANLTETINVGARYNPSTNKFDSRVGIKITSAGQYRFVFQESIQTANHIQIASDLVKDHTAVVISSTLLFGSGNIYNFSVL